MVARQARSKKLTLPMFFWNIEKWKRQFLLQIRQANSLLKLYSYQAILRALRTYEGKKVFSLGAPFLDPLIKAEQEKLDRDKQRIVETPAPPVEHVHTEPQAPRPAFVPKQNALSKLKEL